MLEFLVARFDQLWEMVSLGINWLNPNFVLTVAVAAIICYFVYNLRRLRTKISPVAGGVEKANKVFNFATENHEQYFYENYEEISAELEAIPTMRHHWQEFKEHLILPSDAEATTSDAAQLKVKNSLPPSFFFSEEKFIERPIDLRYIDSVPGKLVALGVLFTFVGLSIGIYSATHTLGGMEGQLDTPELNNALMRLLSGASLAFITSVLGIALSLGFSWVEKHKIKDVKKNLNSFVDSLEKCLSFITSEQIHLEIRDATVEQNKKLDGFSNELAIAIGNSVANSISKPLDETFTRMANNIEELKNIQQNFSEKLMQNLVDKMSGNISAEAQRNQKEAAATFTDVQQAFAQQADTMISSQKEMQAAFSNTINHIIDNNSSMAEKLQQTLESFEKLLATSTANIEENKHIQASYKDIVARQQDIVEKFSAISQTIESASADISDASQENKSVASAFRDSADQVRKCTERMGTAWQEYDQKFKDADEAMSKNFEHFEKYTNQFQTMIGEYVRDLTKEFERAITILGEQLEELAELPGKE